MLDNISSRWTYNVGHPRICVDEEKQFLRAGIFNVTVTVTDDDGGVGNDTVTVEVRPIPVDLDIKPGSDPNSLNLNGNGAVPVAVLGRGDVDVTEIDVATITFGVTGTEATPIHSGHIEDVNGDFIPDLVLHPVLATSESGTL